MESTRPPKLLNRAGLSDERHEYHWHQGKAAGRIVYVWLLSKGVRLGLEEDCQQGQFTIDFDLSDGSGFVLDVKSSTMGLLTIPVGQERLLCSAYAYVGISRDRFVWQFVGWIDKAAFWSSAERAHKGERLPNGFPAYYDMAYMQPANLFPPATLLELIQAGQTAAFLPST